jgi:hypothetical protein
VWKENREGPAKQDEVIDAHESGAKPAEVYAELFCVERVMEIPME